MKNYYVTDKSLRQIAKGDAVFPIVDGYVELPTEVALELLDSGQIAKAEDAPLDAGEQDAGSQAVKKLSAAEEKRAKKKAAKEAADAAKDSA